ncbi:MAG: hypothetical protein ABIT01_04565 [Thermoanaerobaculia bacterium]
MFRTARGFLLTTPPAFLVALVSFLVFHPRAAEAYTTYPVLVGAFGQSLSRQPIPRFFATALLFFLIPYLVTGLLLFLADLGIAAAAPLWRRARRQSSTGLPLPPESRFGYLGAIFLLSLAMGMSLHLVSHGGELAGGISIAPLMVAAVPFLAAGAALLIAGLVAIPRALIARFAAAKQSSQRSTA